MRKIEKTQAPSYTLLKLTNPESIEVTRIVNGAIKTSTFPLLAFQAIIALDRGCVSNRFIWSEALEEKININNEFQGGVIEGAVEDYFYLHYIGPGDGYVAMAKKLIPKGICIPYAGDEINTKTNKVLCRLGADYTRSTRQENVAMSAWLRGGISSFFQHAPILEEVKLLTNEPGVAYANFETVFIKGYPFLIALEDIAPYTMVTFDYDMAYFKDQPSPNLYYQKGAIFPKEKLLVTAGVVDELRKIEIASVFDPEAYVQNFLGRVYSDFILEKMGLLMTTVFSVEVEHFVAFLKELAQPVFDIVLERFNKLMGINLNDDVDAKKIIAEIIDIGVGVKMVDAIYEMLSSSSQQKETLCCLIAMVKQENQQRTLHKKVVLDQNQFRKEIIKALKIEVGQLVDGLLSKKIKINRDEACKIPSALFIVSTDFLFGPGVTSKGSRERFLAIIKKVEKQLLVTSSKIVKQQQPPVTSLPMMMSDSPLYSQDQCIGETIAKMLALSLMIGNYGDALRKVCRYASSTKGVNDPEVVNVVKMFVVDNKKIITKEIIEAKVGTPPKSALDYAAGHPEVLKILQQAVLDESTSFTFKEKGSYFQ